MDTINIPLPKSSSKRNEKYSPSQYSPSRATTPLSDEEPPLPPPSASPPPIPKAPQGKKVLMASQAKKRLQAFITQNQKLNKKRTADIFQNDEDDTLEAISKKGKKSEKEISGKSEIQKIMEEELKVKEMHQEARMNLIKENIEKQIKQQEENQLSERNGENKTEEKVENVGGESKKKDLRDQLREKRRNEEDKKKEDVRPSDDISKRKETNREKEDLREILDRMKSKGRNTNRKGRRSRSQSQNLDTSNDIDDESGDERRSKSGRGTSPHNTSKSDRDRDASPTSPHHPTSRSHRSEESKKSRPHSRAGRKDKSEDDRSRSPSPKSSKLGKNKRKQSLSPSDKSAKSRSSSPLKPTTPKSSKSKKKSKRDQNSPSPPPSSQRDSGKKKKKHDEAKGNQTDEYNDRSIKKANKMNDRTDDESGSESEKERIRRSNNKDGRNHKRAENRETSEGRTESRLSMKSSSDVPSSAEKKRNKSVNESPDKQKYKKKKSMKEKSGENTPKKRKKNAKKDDSLDTTVDIASSIDEDYYAVLPVEDADYLIVHGVQQPQDRQARGQVLRFKRTSQLETVYCQTKITWSHNPQIDRENKNEELKASVDSVLMELEREVAIASQSDTQDESNKSKKKKLKKKKKKGKSTKDVEKIKKILEKINKAKKKLKKNKGKGKEKEKKEKVEDEENIESVMDHEITETEPLKENEESDKCASPVSNSQPETPVLPQPVPEPELEQPEEATEGIAPPLSSSGMNKLFALAGYQPVEKKQEVELPQEKIGEVFGSPDKSKKAIEQKVSPPDPLRFSIKKSPGIELKNKLSPHDDSPQFYQKKDDEGTPDTMNSPLHKEEIAVDKDIDIKKVEEPMRSPSSPTPPRLPKMRDSRSPAKVPIMRDRRSPIEKRFEDEVKNERSREREYGSKSQSETHSNHEIGREVDQDIRRKYVSPRRAEKHYHISPKGKENNEYVHRQSSPSSKQEGPSPRKYSPRRDYANSRGGHFSPRRDYDGSPRRYSPKVERSPRSDHITPKRRYSPRRDERSPQPLARKDVLSPQPRLSPRREMDYDSRHRSPHRKDHYVGEYKSDRDRQYEARSPYNERGASDRRTAYSPRYRDSSPSRRQSHNHDRYSPRRSPRAYSPSRYSPSRRRKESPPSRDRYRVSRGYSPPRHSPRRLSPTQRSPRRYTPDRYSPPRRRHGSPISPRRYSRDGPRRLSPTMRRPSEDRYGSYERRSPRGYSPRGASPERFLSPYRSPHPRMDRMQNKDSTYRSPLPEMRPDSTIPDSELRNLEIPQNVTQAKDVSGSPKRVSLDERLEKELGLEREPLPPPPLMPTKAPTLPTSIPTYDDQIISKPVIAPEKEQAMAAAQIVASKLMEMQAAKEAERAKKREQRMAERLAAVAQQTENVTRLEVGGIEKITATGRILEHVEAQEMVASEEQLRLAKKRQRGDAPSTPTLITLKPREKKQKKKKVEPVVQEEDWPEYSDTPRSPVPIPDNSVCKSVLVKFGFGVSKEAGKKKSVKYRDGVLPGRSSPLHPANGEPDLDVEKSKNQVKRYKKMKVVVISDKRSDELAPPGPPPGSPPRFHTSDLITKFAEARLLETKT